MLLLLSKHDDGLEASRTLLMSELVSNAVVAAPD